MPGDPVEQIAGLDFKCPREFDQRVDLGQPYPCPASRPPYGYARRESQALPGRDRPGFGAGSGSRRNVRRRRMLIAPPTARSEVRHGSASTAAPLHRQRPTPTRSRAARSTRSRSAKLSGSAMISRRKSSRVRWTRPVRHVLFRTTTGKICVDAYQVKGEGATSSGERVPDWRQMNLAKITSIELRDGTCPLP